MGSIRPYQAHRDSWIESTDLGGSARSCYWLRESSLGRRTTQKAWKRCLATHGQV